MCYFNLLLSLNPHRVFLEEHSENCRGGGGGGRVLALMLVLALVLMFLIGVVIGVGVTLAVGVGVVVTVGVENKQGNVNAGSKGDFSLQTFKDIQFKSNQRWETLLAMKRTPPLIDA